MNCLQIGQLPADSRGDRDLSSIMIKVINNIPKLVLLVYMVIKVWEILPITIKEDLPELILSNIGYGLISLNLLYFTYWVWICPMDRIRGVKTIIKDLCLIKTSMQF